MRASPLARTLVALLLTAPIALVGAVPASAGAPSPSTPTDSGQESPANGPSASIGDFDCQTFTVPVVLDNSDSSTTTGFLVRWDIIAEDYIFRELAAGETETVLTDGWDHYPLSIIVWTATGNDEELVTGELAVKHFQVACTQPIDLRVGLGRVDCRQKSLALTLENPSAYAHTFVVNWNGPRGEFRLPPETTRQVAVRVTARNALLNVFAFPDDDEPHYGVDEPVDVLVQNVRADCPRTAALAQPVLAATGGTPTLLVSLGPALVLAGLLLMAASSAGPARASRGCRSGPAGR